jgi:hypothetical protein
VYEGFSFFTSSLYWLLSVFFIIAILVYVNCYLIVSLICFSLMANDNEHVSLHVLIGHLCIFLREMSIRILFSFFLKTVLLRKTYIYLRCMTWHFYYLAFSWLLICNLWDWGLNSGLCTC